MAEGFAQAWRSDEIEAYSAGVESHGLNHLAVLAMAEAGVDISAQTSKTVEAWPTKEFDYRITMRGQANENCPYFPGKMKRLHAGFDDPPTLARQAQTQEEAMVHHRRVREEIKRFIRDFPPKS